MFAYSKARQTKTKPLPLEGAEVHWERSQGRSSHFISPFFSLTCKFRLQPYQLCSKGFSRVPHIGRRKYRKCRNTLHAFQSMDDWGATFTVPCRMQAGHLIIPMKAQLADFKQGGHRCPCRTLEFPYCQPQTQSLQDALPWWCPSKNTRVWKREHTSFLYLG